MNEAYEQAKQDLVETVIRFLEAGDQAGKGQAEMTADFMATFARAAESAQVAC